MKPREPPTQEPFPSTVQARCSAEGSLGPTEIDSTLATAGVLLRNNTARHVPADGIPDHLSELILPGVMGQK